MLGYSVQFAELPNVSNVDVAQAHQGCSPFIFHAEYYYLGQKNQGYGKVLIRPTIYMSA